MLDPAEFGKAMAQIVKDAVAPLEARIRELEGRDLVKDLLATDSVQTLVGLEVAAYLEENPPEPGTPGKDGAPGRDGLDVKDLFRAEGGRLLAVMADGTTKDLGQFVGKDGENGKDGRDGVDGLGFEDAEVELADGAVTLKFKRGDVVKAVEYPIPTFQHIGFWGDGKSANAGEFTTHDGCLWLALRATKQAPSYQSADWQLAARKGADGQRGKDGKDFKPSEPVRLSDGK